MSIIAAASTGKVRYAATIALRAGKVPPMAQVFQPVMSANAAQVSVVNNTKVIKAALAGANGQQAATPHQVKLLAAMASVSGQSVGTPANRVQADQWAIAWFKRNNNPVGLEQLLCELSGAPYGEERYAA